MSPRSRFGSQLVTLADGRHTERLSTVLLDEARELAAHPRLEQCYTHGVGHAVGPRLGLGLGILLLYHQQV